MAEKYKRLTLCERRTIEHALDQNISLKRIEYVGGVGHPEPLPLDTCIAQVGHPRRSNQTLTASIACDTLKLLLPAGRIGQRRRAPRAAFGVWRGDRRLVRRSSSQRTLSPENQSDKLRVGAEPRRGRQAPLLCAFMPFRLRIDSLPPMTMVYESCYERSQVM
jgi:hypothetical protein